MWFEIIAWPRLHCCYSGNALSVDLVWALLCAAIAGNGHDPWEAGVLAPEVARFWRQTGNWVYLHFLHSKQWHFGLINDKVGKKSIFKVSNRAKF